MQTIGMIYLTLLLYIGVSVISISVCIALIVEAFARLIIAVDQYIIVDQEPDYELAVPGGLILRLIF